jgi:FixJ family two-component response regulator
MAGLRQRSAIIAVLDDDPSVRRRLERLIRSTGWKAPSCVVLDLQLSGVSGIDLKKRMAKESPR